MLKGDAWKIFDSWIFWKVMLGADGVIVKTARAEEEYPSL